MDLMLTQKRYLTLLTALLLVFLLHLPALTATQVVSKDGESFRSIQTAIDGASVGDTILVKEGTYEENLTVNKDLTIKGADKEKVQITGKRNGHPVLLIGPKNVEVTVKDVTLKGARGAKCQNKEKGICTRGISALGEAHIIVKESSITDNSAGIILDGNTKSKVIDSDIKSNFHYGLELADSASASVINVEASGHKFYGIGLKNFSKAKIKNSTFSKNRWGVRLRSFSTSTIKNNNIIKNDVTGIYVSGLADTTISENNIEDNGEIGISFSGSTFPRLKNNVIRNHGIGIAIFNSEEFEGSLKGFGNKLIDNNSSFLGISEETRIELQEEPSWQRNAIVNGKEYESLQPAIDAASPGDTVFIKSGTYEENLTVNKDLTLKSKSKEKVKIKGKTDGQPVLLIGPKNVKVTVKGLTLKEALGGKCENEEKGVCPRGISATGKAQITAKGSTITGNSVGILLGDNSRGEIIDSDVSSNFYTGIEVTDKASAHVDNIKASGHKFEGILVKDSTRAVIKNSKITDDRVGIDVYDSIRVTIINNEITHHRISGISLSGSVEATLAKNEITKVTSGIRLSDSTNTTMKNNTINKSRTGVKVLEPKEFTGAFEGYGNRLLYSTIPFSGVSKAKQVELQAATPKASRQGKAVVNGKKYQSLQAAIDAAFSGDTVKVNQGTFKENLFIDKDITLMGSGRFKSWIVSPKKRYPVLRVGPSEVEVTLKGLTLTRATAMGCKDSEKGICPSGIAAIGKAKLTVKNCRFTYNVSGISLQDSSQAFVEDSLLAWNTTGIDLEHSAKVLIKDTSIFVNEYTGVLVEGRATADVIDSTISHSKGGVRVWGSAKVKLKGNDIKHNSSYGVSLAGSVQANISNNEISSNHSGLSVVEQVEATIKNNSIVGNDTGVGPWSSDEGYKASLKGFGNQLANNEEDFEFIPKAVQKELLAKTRKVNATVGKDEFQFIQAAIFASDPGETVYIKPGTYEENLKIDKDITLKGAGETKVIIRSYEKPHSVALVGPSDIDVTIKNVTLADTHHSKCKSSRVCPNGIYLDGKANLKLESVTIQDSGKEGIRVCDEAKVTVVDSTIKDNQRKGIWLTDSAKAIIKNSKISNNCQSGIRFSDYSKTTSFPRVTVVDSVVSNNGWGGIYIEAVMRTEIKNNEIAENNNGIDIRDFYRAKISGNIVKNNVTGIQLHKFTLASLINNSISANRTGIKVKKAERFPSKLSGYGNQVQGNGTNFEGVPRSRQTKLTDE